MQGRSRRSQRVAAKENHQPSPTSAASSSTKKKGGGRSKKQYCVCKGNDDGTPMINCSYCKDWFHFRCVNISEDDADDIKIYVCPPCEVKTGRRTVRDYEGPEALETVNQEETDKFSKHVVIKEDSDADASPAEAPSASEDDASEDEYVEENGKPNGKGKRTTRRLSLSSESDTEPTTTKRRSSSAKAESSGPSPSPGASVLKRKSSNAPQPTPKRRKSSSAATTTSTASDDPARVFCLKKYQELFCKIFLQRPHVAPSPTVGPEEESTDHLQDSANKLQAVKPEELTSEQKADIETRANAYAAEVEQCTYEIYAEPGKDGKPHAGPKYKDRFRTLTFNLSQPDRVVLHERIASSHLNPKELSQMSSTDLASEEAKQTMKQAEKEALEHSILQKTLVPRAKITHKGFEDIEDINGEMAKAREREQEDDERRERERLARLRTAESRAGPTSGSVPPESPVTPHTPQTPSWGAPPPLPVHVVASPTDGLGRRPPVNPLFVPSGSDLMTPIGAEPELNLADLINIDDEIASPSEVLSTSITQSDTAAAQSPAIEQQQQPSSSSITGISPFAANVSRPETRERSASFDLNSLWTGAKHDEQGEGAQPSVARQVADEPPKDGGLEPEGLAGEAQDQDFDMFLDDEDTVKEPESSNDHEISGPREQDFAASPPVWSGKISMPLDSTVPQETPVIARQMGGRQLGHSSPLWQTLFPSDHLRIDGRVPVDKSAAYLLQTRMNPTKEVIAVAFSSDGGDSLQTLIDYLIAKGRHGLIFPWGNRPKDHHPGREMYIVPLLASEPLPDYMELLEELCLPKQRIANYLIGLWILVKGKLAPPPTPSVPLATTSAVPAPQPQGSPAPHPPSSAPSSSNDLATQVASLTPEQIQEMLRALASSGLAIPGSQPPGPPIIPPAPPLIPPAPHLLAPTPPVPALYPSPAWTIPPPTVPAAAPYPPPPAPGYAHPPYPPGGSSPAVEGETVAEDEDAAEDLAIILKGDELIYHN
ncbi:hypothetical protein PUNSTDRAFT_145392 [Punctularia strigosozonata HHB-11173 SS5]|uniref:uncharacterized protein n=1 Tax=Punctularia strigosozonata (strain HHB-11173) TaxID=741275 RepID=UPI0004416E48|nr:uncharacterized protein PUNSTDRAFT_145392 [Punctularia strigosozonata HHB-11173 SS5]EIN06001.1 hypothetical protein PUNSTDRAFT_145392 [Punctularia strigosozonata HHB-11173 SS5]